MRLKKLIRQLKQHFGSDHIEAEWQASAIRLAASPNTEDQMLATQLAAFTVFLDAIEQSYLQYEDKNKMAVRNLQISSDEQNTLNRELDELYQSVQAMLEALGEGLCFFNRDGICSSVYSKACFDLLETIPANRPIADILRLNDEQRQNLQRWLNLAFREETAMSFDDLAALAPGSYAHSEGRAIRLTYRPLKDHGGAMQAILLIATDVTQARDAKLLLEEREHRAKRVLRIARNRNGFVRLLVHLQELVSEWERLHDAPDAMLMQLHTLKGVASAFHLGELTEALHQLEGLIKQGERIDAQHPAYQTLLKAMQQAEQDGGEIFGEGFETHGDLLTLNERQISHLLKQVQAHYPSEASHLCQLIEYELTARSIPEFLSEFHQQLQELAERFGKKVQICYEGDAQLRLLPSVYRGLFQSFVHLARNIVDHGIEEPALRRQFGKADSAQVTIRWQYQQQGLSITISDDGMGVDTESLRKSLGEHNVSLDDHALLQRLFEPSITTRGSVSHLSGRGVGLYAVAQAVKQLGGAVRLDSQMGKGTCLLIDLPHPAMPALPSRKQQAHA